MSEREWKPGDVAMVEVGCRANRHVGIFDGGGWRYGDGKWTANDPAIVTARPLVVIDPDARAVVEALRDGPFVALEEQNPGRYELSRGVFGNALQAALREFANPTPPKPDEPTGLGAVVEDADGLRWVREADGWWGSPQQFDTRNWPAVDAVRILSHGVTEGER